MNNDFLNSLTRLTMEQAAEKVAQGYLVAIWIDQKNYVLADSECNAKYRISKEVYEKFKSTAAL